MPTSPSRSPMTATVTERESCSAEAVRPDDPVEAGENRHRHDLRAVIGHEGFSSAEPGALVADSVGRAWCFRRVLYPAIA
jgi:hypothetical protein